MNNKTKRNKLNTYYIVVWNDNCWDSFIQHQVHIWICYKLKEGYIQIEDYKENPIDNYYIPYDGHRKYLCFKWKSKEDIFIDLEKAKKYANIRIDEMYLSRCKYLIKERDEATKKITNYKENKND